MNTAHLPVFRMKTHVFESFRGMIDEIPAKAIPKAIALEHFMLEQDLLHNRISYEEEEVSSILTFCQFFKALIAGNPINPVVLPVRHIAFYREVILRLVKAGEMTWHSLKRFDRTFSSGFLITLSQV